MNEESGFDKKISRHITLHAELYDHACYVLNPDFDNSYKSKRFNKEIDLDG